jgi:hypothetical protein
MKKIKIAIILAAALLLSAAPVSVLAAGDTTVIGAGAGVYPSGTQLSGVTLSGLQFGQGVLIFADGSAEGDFEAVLLGTTILGAPQNITVEGKVSAGATNADGSVTFSGTATADMGDGTLPAVGVPFSVTATTQGLQLTLGASILPLTTLSAGGISIE